MNENIDLRRILRHCPLGTVLYSDTFGYVKYWAISPNPNDIVPISVRTIMGGFFESFTADGACSLESNKCDLFPSATQRDWNKFVIPWRDKFDPDTFRPVDLVLIKINDIWTFSVLEKYVKEDVKSPFHCITGNASICIPYNDETKHLVGTTEDCPEYYKWWEEQL